MKALKIASAAVAAILAVAALLLIAGVPSGLLASAIQHRVERETGYRLTIAGSTRIGLWPSLKLTIDDVTLERPQDRDAGHRLTAGSIEAGMTFGSVWSGRPEITELAIVRPVLHVPLRRERSAAAKPASSGPAPAPAREADSNAPVIPRITVSDGTVAFSNPRDRVDQRIEGINAGAVVGADRRISVAGSARAGGHPLTFGIKAAAARAAAAAAERSGRTDARRARPAAGAVVGQGRGPAQRRGGHDQRPQRHDRRRRLHRMGVGRRREQAAAQARSRLPAARHRRCRGAFRAAGFAGRFAILARHPPRNPGATHRSTSTG